jgi:hypothetical protein
MPVPSQGYYGFHSFLVVDWFCLFINLWNSLWKIVRSSVILLLPLLAKLKSSLRKFYGLHHVLVDRYGTSVTNDHGYIPLVVNTFRSFPHSWFIIEFVTRLTQRVSLVEQERLTIPEHLGSPPVFSGVRVAGSLVLCVIFCRSLFVHLSFFFCPLCCLSSDLRILIAPLVSSNSSCAYLCWL